MPPKKKLTPRELMEKAIEVMRQSVSEPRPDHDTPPVVGVVLVKPNGDVETAFRGELRQGDHAEFTLLERKNRSNSLEGSILYTTLEPCAPGSRNPPKVDCAERIVNARIKEVWVGITDPHPKVDRKGIQFLEDNGVTIRMFDRDLQEIVKAENSGFLEQALERKADHHAQSPKLSLLEDPLLVADLTDFSRDALQLYASRAQLPDKVGSVAFQRRLERQGLLIAKGKATVATGFGLLLFGNHPREAMPQAGLLATIHYAGGQDESRDFDGPLVMIPEELERWLTDKLPNVVDRSRMRRRQASDVPMEMVREAVVNALIHRQYDIDGAKCQIVINDETITVMSPGQPVHPITLEQLQQFTAPMLSRNPRLHYVFAKMELAEERGLGLQALRDRSMSLGLPLPRYRWRPPYLELVLYRTPAGVEHELTVSTLESLNTSERAGWQWLSAREVVTAAAYASGRRLPKRTALNHLRKFLDLGLVEIEGSGPSTRYRIPRNG